MHKARERLETLDFQYALIETDTVLAEFYSKQSTYTDALEWAEKVIGKLSNSERKEIIVRMRFIGNLTEARTITEEAVAIVEKSREKVSSQEYSQTRFLNSRFLAYQNLMPILNEMGEKEKALAASEFFKGRILWDVIRTGKTNTSEKIKSSSSVLLVGIYFNWKKLKAEACA